MSAYVKFLEIKLHLDDAFIKKYGIDQRSIKLLEYIAIGELNSSPMIVTQLMHGGQFGSPATIHRSLSTLRDSKLLVFLHQGTDRKTKYPALTRESKEHLDNVFRVFLSCK
jgi:hypothetical protein